MTGIDRDLGELVLGSIREALVRSAHDIGAALADFGWAELAATDEPFAFTALFEEQGYLGVDTDALDVVLTGELGLGNAASVIWRPVASVDGAIEGIALRGVEGAGRSLLVSVNGVLRRLEAESVEEAPLGGMASDTRWVRVRIEGSSTEIGFSWPIVERKARLAVASELVGVSRRIIDVAVAQVSDRRQFGQPIGAYQAVRHRLAEAYAEMVGARGLVAAAWENGSETASIAALAVAAPAHDAVAKHAIQVCGAIGLSEEHELPRLVRRGFALDALVRPDAPEHVTLGHALRTAEPPAAVGIF